MKYVFLGLAIILEVIGSSLLKASNGFTKLVPTVLMGIAFIGCFYFLSQALKEIPLGVAYAIWAGLGIILTAIVSVVIFKQTLDLPAIIGIALILSGVVVMNYFSNSITQ
ncbi:multidrug efflux SMR transporter [Pseudoxanthomonas sp. SGD-10]|nr:multidrug efflux SMR transporter [Pseudoxanthomonas sp. SGD-10]